jgi:hypothetical protein
MNRFITVPPTAYGGEAASPTYRPDYDGCHKIVQLLENVPQHRGMARKSSL